MPVCVFFLLKLQSVFKDISYMVDPQNKVQVPDSDHVSHHSPLFSILS